jgi:hypothetical protein
MNIEHFAEGTVDLKFSISNSWICIDKRTLKEDQSRKTFFLIFKSANAEKVFGIPKRENHYIGSKRLFSECFEMIIKSLEFHADSENLNLPW